MLSEELSAAGLPGRYWYLVPWYLVLALCSRSTSMPACASVRQYALVCPSARPPPAAPSRRYQEWGWKIFEAFELHAKVKGGGYADLDSVRIPGLTYLTRLTYRTRPPS